MKRMSPPGRINRRVKRPFTTLTLDLDVAKPMRVHCTEKETTMLQFMREVVLAALRAKGSSLVREMLPSA